MATTSASAYNQIGPHGTWAKQPLHIACLCHQGRESAAAPPRTRRFPCYHQVHLCTKVLSGQNRRPRVLIGLASMNMVTPAIEYTRSMLCGIIYLGTVSNYSRSVLIFAILTV